MYSKGTRQGHMAYRLAHPIPSRPSSDVRRRPSLSITAQAAVSHLVPAHSAARGLCRSHLPPLLMSALPTSGPVQSTLSVRHLCARSSIVLAGNCVWAGDAYGLANCDPYTRLASGLLAGPEGMCYCGPAVHTLFIGSTRMAGDDDFIKSGKEGGAGLGLGGPAF